MTKAEDVVKEEVEKWISEVERPLGSVRKGSHHRRFVLLLLLLLLLLPMLLHDSSHRRLLRTADLVLLIRTILTGT